MSDFPLLLASEMGVTRRTVTRWCVAGKIPGAYRTKGGHWRLRRPRLTEGFWRKYDDGIIEFVVRYTRVPGSPLSARQAALLNKIMRWVAETKLLGIALYVGRGLTHQAENTTRPETNWKFAESFGKLIDSKEFNNALEFSLVAAGMCEDDQPPKGWNSPAEGMSPDLLEHFKDLNARDPKRFKLSIESEISKLMHPRAYEATATTEGVLMVKAQKLSLNMLPVTPANLARELGISIAKLRGQYGREAVRRACAPSPTREESSKRVRYQLG